MCRMIFLMLLIFFDGHVIKSKLAFRSSSALIFGLGGSKESFLKEPQRNTKIYGLKWKKC